MSFFSFISLEGCGFEDKKQLYVQFFRYRNLRILNRPKLDPSGKLSRCNLDFLTETGKASNISLKQILYVK